MAAPRNSPTALDLNAKQGNGAVQAPPPDTPLTVDSPSLGARRRLGHDATNTTKQGGYPARDDAMTSIAATVSTLCLHLARYDVILLYRKYISYPGGK